MKASRKTNQETEIKLAAPDLKDARRRLRAAGFRVAKRRIYEENTIYDTPGLKLRKAQSLVRVRQVGSRAKMTYKGPPLPGRHKSREELEIDI
jgi:adenylate cyclase, class 2